ncbi:MAG: glycosyltransferase family 87 protein [Planctomycetota bacterium]
MSTATDNTNYRRPQDATSRAPRFFELRRRSELLVLLLPLLVVIVVMACSPNYRPVAGVRPSPLGGDFVQDYVGGAIVLSPSRSQLYDQGYFRSVQHDAAVVGFEWSESSYYPPVYPPFYYLAVSPFASVSYDTAVMLWGILSALALVATGWLWFRYFPECRKRFAWIWIGAMLFAPTLYTFNIGHKSTFLLLILSATYLLLFHKRSMPAGMVFGLLLFKPHLALVIGAAMLWKRQWAFVAGAAVTASILMVVSLAIGPGLCLDFVNVCLGSTDYVQTGGYQLTSAYSFWAFVKLLLPGASSVQTGSIAITASLAVAAVMSLILRGRLDTSSHRFAMQFSALVLAMVLIGPHFYFYDLTIVLIVVFLVVATTDLNWQDSPAVLPARKALFFCTIGMLLLAGFFGNVAVMTALQPGVIVMATMIGLIAWLTRCPASQDPELSAQADAS